MQVQNLASLEPGGLIETDLVIIGGGPVGLTIAREFFGTAVRILVLESGETKETTPFAALNAVESAGAPWTEAQTAKRTAFHGDSAAFWRAEEQAFGVRCRGLGGSTWAWAGKSAAFDDTDFAQRDWVPHSGWPIGRDELDPYLDRAAGVLNLGPNCYDDRLWELMGVAPPKPHLDATRLRSFFWQFARSRLDPMDLMRFGPEFLTFDAPNVQVLLNATVTEIRTDDAGAAFRELEVSTIQGGRSRIRAKAAVLAAGGIENPRLLLASNRTAKAGLGNQHDLVGRYLLDHPGARIGRFSATAAKSVADRFGFYGVRHDRRTHMYMHGLTPSAELQAREKLLNSAVYMLEDRAPDDPWGALKRLAKRESNQPLSDVLALAKSPGLLAKGLGMKLFESRLTPDVVRRGVINLFLRYNAGFVVREFQSRGLPHKLDGLFLDAISEQTPDSESRITLSDRQDPFGVPLAKVDWRIDEAARRTLIRLGHLTVEEFTRAGLPPPELESWVLENRPQDAVIIDMGHTAGATRMSSDPTKGVVDAQCQVHGVSGLFVAGGSVFPTSGHANPTLMMLALAIRLSDHLKGACFTAPKGAQSKIKAKGKAMKTVLVTGATGAIGKELVPALVARGYKVRATFNRTPGTLTDVEWVRLDLSKPQDLSALTAGCDAVIHLAAELSDPSQMDRLNVEATMELVKSAEASGVRYFGYASSIVVYGSPKAGTVDEQTPIIDPGQPVAKQYIADFQMCEYARTKAASEMAIIQAAPRLHLDIYRPTVVASDRRLLESGDWGKPRKALQAGACTQYVMVDDVVEAMAHLMERGLKLQDVGVEIFNLCDEDAPTYGALLRQAHQTRGEGRFKAPPAIPLVFDLLKSLKAGMAFSGRRSLGRLRFSSRKLVDTGFKPRRGVKAALDAVLKEG